MFAIVRSGGKQYRVEKDHTIVVEKLCGEVGAQVELKDVLLLGAGAGGRTVVGAPMIAEACVRAEIIRQDRLPKITVFKKKRRKNYRRTRGHRQPMTWLRIGAIEAPAGMFPPASVAMTEAAKEREAAPTPAPVASDSARAAVKDAASVETAGAPATDVADIADDAATPAATPAAPVTPAAASAEADDLKKLPGIGTATERKLNDIGIRHYRQIAAGDENLAEALAKQPALAKILQREDVVKQAAALAKQAQTESEE